MELKDKKGQVGSATAIAGMAIMLYIVMVVIGNLQGVGTSALASNTAALAAYNNVTTYTVFGVVLGSIGLIVFAGMALMGMLGRKR